MAAFGNAQFNAIFGEEIPALQGIPLTFPHPIGRTLNLIAEEWGLDDNSTGICMLAMICRVYTMRAINNSGLQAIPILADQPANVTWAATTAIGATTSGNAAMVGNALNAVPNTAAGSLFRSIMTAYGVCPRWILELVAANQVRRLTNENVVSYFQSINVERVNGATILSLIIPLSSVIGKVVTNDALRAVLSPTDWIRYHTNATSTPILVQRAIEFIGTSIPGFWAPATLNAVTAAIAAPWNKQLSDAIPRKAVAATHAILTALRQCPKEWYQGNKAKTAMPASTYAAWILLAEKIQELTANEATIRAATTFANLATSAPATCLGC